MRSAYLGSKTMPETHHAKSAQAQDTRAILKPYTREEAFRLKEASAYIDRCTKTVKRLCNRHGLGRVIGNQMEVSRVALQMYLEEDQETLDLYLAGDRTSATVTAYYARLGITLPVSRAAA